MLPKTILKLILGAVAVPAFLSVHFTAPAPAGKPRVVRCGGAIRVAPGRLAERLAFNADGSVGTVVAPAAAC